MAKPGVSIAQETVFNSISSLLGIPAITFRNLPGPESFRWDPIATSAAANRGPRHLANQLQPRPVIHLDKDYQGFNQQ